MNCKPGDLAYIVRSEIQANLGAVVEVLSINIELTNIMGEPFWNVRACRPLEVMHGGLAELGNIEDRRLRPISGVPMREEERDEVKA